LPDTWKPVSQASLSEGVEPSKPLKEALKILLDEEPEQQ